MRPLTPTERAAVLDADRRRKWPHTRPDRRATATIPQPPKETQQP